MVQGEPPYLALAPTKVSSILLSLMLDRTSLLIFDQALLYLTTRGVPPIRHAEEFSPMFHSFLPHCLHRDRRLRANADQLLMVRTRPTNDIRNSNTQTQRNLGCGWHVSPKGSSLLSRRPRSTGLAQPVRCSEEEYLFIYLQVVHGGARLLSALYE